MSTPKSRLLRSPWRPGPAHAASGTPVLVSVTDFTALGHGQAGAIALAGLRLRRTWARTPGAVGMWLWTDPRGKRSGSVSVWADERSLGDFVARPDHLRTVRAHRGRGTMRATSWTAERFDPQDVWAAARLFLTRSTKGIS
ncbi:hypothetical protein [Streptomyces sp. NPDC059009]|uniref:hypothetical protein n=1 Tax=Streptomyces sp. NPDC059009 TaxID=3346694 RepID=UPI00369A3298